MNVQSFRAYDQCSNLFILSYFYVIDDGDGGANKKIHMKNIDKKKG